jgi:hypothetical protein
MSIQCAYLPHAISQANSSNKTAILSTFTNYDGACPRIMVTVPPPPHRLDLGKKLCLARGRFSLGTNFASPDPGIGFLPSANPAEGHSFNCVMHGCEPRSRLSIGLRKTSASPEHGFSLDNTNEGASYVTRNSRADVLPRAFHHTHHCFNHYYWDSFPNTQARVHDRAPALASVPYVVKDANTGTRHPLTA